jgi:hypothetical protein
LETGFSNGEERGMTPKTILVSLFFLFPTFLKFLLLGNSPPLHLDSDLFEK